VVVIPYEEPVIVRPQATGRPTFYPSALETQNTLGSPMPVAVGLAPQVPAPARNGDVPEVTPARFVGAAALSLGILIASGFLIRSVVK